MNIIDRRPNPKGKSLANRQRFIDRARGEVKRALSDALKRRKVGESDGGEKVSIPTRAISEPMFHPASTGGLPRHTRPRHYEFIVGDSRPRSSSPSCARSRTATPE